MGWKADCMCGMLRVVDTYGDYAAMCLYDKTFCYAAEPMDNSLKTWKVVHPERCELPKSRCPWYGKPFKVTIDRLDEDNFVTTTVYKYGLHPDTGPLESILSRWRESGTIYDYLIEIWEESDEQIPHKVVWKNGSGYEIWDE